MKMKERFLFRLVVVHLKITNLGLFFFSNNITGIRFITSAIFIRCLFERNFKNCQCFCCHLLSSPLSLLKLLLNYFSTYCRFCICSFCSRIPFYFFFFLNAAIVFHSGQVLQCVQCSGIQSCNVFALTSTNLFSTLMYGTYQQKKKEERNT